MRPAPRADTAALANAALQFKRVSLHLGARRVLEQIDLRIETGEFIGVLGPNGAGKTTLMRAALGLIAPVTGRITVLDKPVARGNAAIGYLPQMRNTAAGRRVRGYDFVACAAQGGRWGMPLPNKARRMATETALERVGATALARRPLGDMSGGERQRLLLAQCLLDNPRLLLLDEPLISLDPHRQQEVVDLIKRIQRESGITVLFSAHELNPLLGALDRVLYLGNGHAALGTVDEVITTPVLSRLYGAPIEVLRTRGRIFVMSRGIEIERRDHGHEHGDGPDEEHVPPSP